MSGKTNELRCLARRMDRLRERLRKQVEQMKEKYNNFLIYTGVPNRDNVLRILQEGRHIDTAMKLAPWNKRTCMSGLTIV